MRTNQELNYLAIKLRKQFNEDEYSKIDIFSLCEKIDGLSIVLYPLGEHISGICIKNKSTKVIAINSSMSKGRQRFSLAHELYHLYVDNTQGTIISKINLDNSNYIEKEANTFASYLLMPYNALRQFIDNEENTKEIELILKIEHEFEISHQATLVRLLMDGIITKKEYDKYSKIKINEVSWFNDYPIDLYNPTKEPLNKRTYGHYIKQVNELKNKNMISNGKYEELLLDAFRDDLVFSSNKGTIINDWYLFLWYRLFI